MADQDSSWNAIMQYSFLRVFANDGTIDSDEMAMLQRLALRDGTVDERERAVLSRIFARVAPDTVSPGVWDEICRFKAQHRISSVDRAQKINRTSASAQVGGRCGNQYAMPAACRAW